MSSGEEFLIGTIIGGRRIDGTCKGYDPSLPGVTWNQLLTLIAAPPVKGGQDIQDMEIMFLGATYRNGGCGAIGFAKRTRDDVQEAVNPYWGGPGQPAGPRAITSDPAMTGQLVHDLLFLNEIPQHIVGIVVRKLR